MYVKSFERYIKESLMDEESDGEVLQFQLREFNNKKGNLKNLVLNNIDNDKDISRNYQDIVGENPFLNSYGNMLKIQSTIVSKENRLKELAEEINSLQKDVSLTGKLGDESDSDQQKTNIEDQIKDKNKDVKSEEDQIKELQEKIRLMEEGLKEFIKEKTQDLKGIQKNVII
tara:strand:- start:11912 stop:12427 length:516 start_codon:yes stop_codon:yes gene_type:complete